MARTVLMVRMGLTDLTGLLAPMAHTRLTGPMAHMVLMVRTANQALGRTSKRSLVERQD